MSFWLLFLLFVFSYVTKQPSAGPTLEPTFQPSNNPTLEPTIAAPTLSPTYNPTEHPVTNAECIGYSNCWGKIITDYGLLTCNGEYSCSYSTFKCKNDSICHLQCNSEQSGYSCADMNVDARYAKLLTVTSTDIDSVYDLQNSRIYCPIRSYQKYNHSCIVYYAAANREGSDFINTKFYTMNGLKDIDFRGNIDGLSTILKYNISVFYGNKYSKQCIIKMNVDNSLVCIDSHHDYTSPAPTSTINTTAAESHVNPLQNNPLFCRGYHFLQDDIAGSNVIDCNYNNNIDAFNDMAKSCQYSSLSFSTAYSSYESYSTTDSTSIAATFNGNGAEAAGSLSYSRLQTSTTIKNSQSYIYRLDFTCVEADINLPSYPKVKWDDDFLNDLQKLPTQFTFDISNYDVYSYEEFVNFWKKYGTHVIQSAKLGGRVYGTVIIDSCAVNKYYSTLRGYTVCLNGEFNGVGGELCEAPENEESTQTSAQYFVSKTTLSVKGGNSETFGEMINTFGDSASNKERSYNEWIESLSESPYVVGGNLQEIYSVIRDIVNSNIGVADTHGMNKYCDDTTLLQIANAMRNAYQVYINKSLSQEASIQCSFDCGTGKLNTQTCQCEKCKGVECCDSADYAVLYEIYMSVMLIFVINIV